MSAEGAGMSLQEQTEQLYRFAQRLMDVSIGIIRDAKIDVTAHWAKDPKVLALALLSRTLTNFKGTVVMLQQELVVEARTLARCCLENLIYIGALREDGSEFVELLLQDEAASRRQRGKFLLARSARLGKEFGWETLLADHLEKQEKKYPKAKLLRPKEVAEGTVISDAYVYYSQLSGDAAHTSVSSLGLHLGREEEDGEIFLKLTVAPEAEPERVYDTLDTACEALIGVCITTNEMLGGTPAGESLRTIFEEFVAMRASARVSGGLEGQSSSG
jgi:Family of unknown function (DUF5677)